jgi:hypothetical protein
VSNTKIVPNIPIYLQENFQNFLTSIIIFPRIISNFVLNGKCIGGKMKTISPGGPNPPNRPDRRSLPGPLWLFLCAPLPCEPRVLVLPTGQWPFSLHMPHLSRDSSPISPVTHAPSDAGNPTAAAPSRHLIACHHYCRAA